MRVIVAGYAGVNALRVYTKESVSPPTHLLVSPHPIGRNTARLYIGSYKSLGTLAEYAGYSNLRLRKIRTLAVSR